MEYVQLSIDDGIATVAINRPKVNAINEQVVSELRDVFLALARDTQVKAVILTGRGSFFSFGFDIPGFMDYPQEAFHRFIMSFSDLVQRIFVFPKPVIAALNGHTVAGGCVLAIACDRRVMVTGKAKIALNELTLGASVFTSIAEILKYTVGSLFPGKISMTRLSAPRTSLQDGMYLRSGALRGFSGKTLWTGSKIMRRARSRISSTFGTPKIHGKS